MTTDQHFDNSPIDHGPRRRPAHSRLIYLRGMCWDTSIPCVTDEDRGLPLLSQDGLYLDAELVCSECELHLENLLKEIEFWEEMDKRGLVFWNPDLMGGEGNYDVLREDPIAHDHATAS